MAVTLIIALSLAAAVSARDSWMNRSATPSTTMPSMTIAGPRVVRVTKETIASSNSRITSGLTQAWPKSLSLGCRCSSATTLGPYRSRRSFCLLLAEAVLTSLQAVENFRRIATERLSPKITDSWTWFVSAAAP